MLKLKQLTLEEEKGRYGGKVGNVGRRRIVLFNNGMIIYEMMTGK
jgi:hypothetical protein